MAESKKVIGMDSACATGVGKETSRSLRKISNLNDANTKQSNVLYVNPNLLWIKEGYNIRDISPDRVENYAQSYADGKYVPPIQVSLVKVNGIERMQVIVGFHRAIALQTLANITEIQVVEIKGDEVELFIQMMTSPESRELTSMETANAYQTMKTLGLNQSEIALELGVTNAQVSNYLQLFKAPAELQAMIQSGDYSATSAWCNIRKSGAEAALLIAKEELRAKAAKQTAKALGNKAPKSKIASKLKTLQLTQTNIEKMSGVVTQLAEQVTQEAMDGDREVELTIDISIAKLIQSLAREVNEINTHNIEASQNLKRIASFKEEASTILLAV